MSSDWRDFVQAYTFNVTDVTKLRSRGFGQRSSTFVEVCGYGYGWQVDHGDGDFYLSAEGKWVTYGEITALSDDEPHAWETFEEAFAALWKAVDGGLEKMKNTSREAK